MAQSSHTLPLFQAADQPSLSCTHVHFSEYPGSTIRRDHIPSQSEVLPYDLQGRKALIRIVHTQGLSCLAASKNNEGLEESDQGTCRKGRLARLQSQHSPPPCATSVHYTCAPTQSQTSRFPIMHPLFALPNLANITYPLTGHSTSFEDLGTWLMICLCIPTPAIILGTLNIHMDISAPSLLDSSASPSSKTFFSPPKPPTYRLEHLL